jgi:hypothetical protein
MALPIRPGETPEAIVVLEVLREILAEWETLLPHLLGK